MRLNFYLTNVKDGRGLLQMRVRLDGRQMAVNLGETLAVKEWDKKRQRVRAQSNAALALNAKLDAWRERALTYIRVQQTQLAPITAPGLREALGKAPKKRPERIETMRQVFALFVDAKRAATTAGTAYAYNQVGASWAAYCPNDVIATIKPTQVAEFSEHLRGTLSASTAARRSKMFKTFLKWAVERGHLPEEWLKAYKPMRKPPHYPGVHLTISQLQALRAVDLTGTLALGRRRDLFLFMCGSGLRYSEAVKLTPASVVDGWLTIVAPKTRKQVRIPLPAFALEVWNRYEGRLPRIANSIFNRELKDVCARAGLVERVQQVRYKGGERQDREVPLYRAVSTHTARRTFIVQALQAGVPLHVVQAMVGHAAISQTMQYVDVVAEEKLKAARKLDDLLQ